MDELDETFCPEIENIKELSAGNRNSLISNSIEQSHGNNADYPGVIEHLNFINKLLTEYLVRNNYSKESKSFKIISDEMDIFNINNCGRIAKNIYNENLNLIITILKKSFPNDKLNKENKRIVSQQHNERDLLKSYSQNTFTKHKSHDNNDKNYVTLSNYNVVQLSTILNIDAHKFKALLNNIVTGKININIYKPNNGNMLNEFRDKIAMENDEFMDPYTENIDYFMKSVL